MTSLTLRQLGPDDLDAYRALRLAGILEAPAAFCTTHAAESAVPLERMRQRLVHTAYQRMFGAFHDGRLVGCAALSREPIALIHDRANIWGVYVAPGARGGGLARQLMHACMAHAAATGELRTLTLSVRRGNDVAEALYARLGFAVVGASDDGEQLRMAMALPPRA
ncbi:MULTISPECIES: GNAT family N-acetyltransferase [unclassified Janthinobacterium]|uniref:GNAT family N-acetyltransferase n=1 Tax=unclassified Janthinobacterium TaxID=2610881 RepID=UPI0009DAAB9A|nr:MULTISPECIES: GNAT family N-acetyltransferase [unclassified Janthinobacterium]MEC5162716.1 ribosomal protein S18 acetylase RimI-like enzyme [Janthinobacterium sp. CG_S6]